MQQFFHKSWVILLYFSAVFFVLIVGLSIIVDLSIDSEDIPLLKFVEFSMLLILLLNLYDVLSLWILGKKKEFFVKKMVGASVWQILWRAFANYWILIVLSFGLGLWCSVLIATISKSFSVQINTALLSLVIGGLISLISGWLMLGRRLQIIQKGKRQ